MIMELYEAKELLNSHGIQWRTDNGLEVLEESTLNGVYGSAWINASDWSRPELMAWLGY
jgi:hypothetical protein